MGRPEHHTIPELLAIAERAEKDAEFLDALGRPSLAAAARVLAKRCARAAGQRVEIISGRSAA